ncbi:hypothetical protein HGRIS_009602 [Hohenbuehelia grisea]|uniref:YDG domain-containing protein n=1 Tax=Hohenbuehelia grisea TaxID=104357 RepID=A0ABR3J232_9AGAR
MAPGGPFKGVNIVRDPNCDPKTHGHIPGVPIGSTWKNREDCSKAGVHSPLRGGIAGNKNDGAFSVVLSGGYEDDEDNGEDILYTGQGGKDYSGDKMEQMQGKSKWDGGMCSDQEWTRGNLALKISWQTGKPVRVIRGSSSKSKYAPASGYRYDGLYRVVQASRETGKEGFQVCRFAFKRLPNQGPLPRHGHPQTQQITMPDAEASASEGEGSTSQASSAHKSPQIGTASTSWIHQSLAQASGSNVTATAPPPSKSKLGMLRKKAGGRSRFSASNALIKRDPSLFKKRIGHLSKTSSSDD